jgi:hypothetical protein
MLVLLTAVSIAICECRWYGISVPQVAFSIDKNHFQPGAGGGTEGGCVVPLPVLHLYCACFAHGLLLVLTYAIHHWHAILLDAICPPVPCCAHRPNQHTLWVSMQLTVVWPVTGTLLACC